MNDGETPAQEPYGIPTLAEVVIAVRQEMRAMHAAELLIGTPLSEQARAAATEATAARITAEHRLNQYISGLDRSNAFLHKQLDAAYRSGRSRR